MIFSWCPPHAPRPFDDSTLFTLDERVDQVDDAIFNLVHPRNARDLDEARRIMDQTRTNLPGLVHPLCSTITNEPTVPHALLGLSAEPTLIDPPITRLIREMIGWRQHPVPGGLVFVIPPRTEPEGWTQDAGVIRPPGHAPDADFPFNFVVFETLGYPRWMRDEQSDFAREFLNEPTCPEGHTRSGKELVG